MYKNNDPDIELLEVYNTGKFEKIGFLSVKNIKYNPNSIRKQMNREEINLMANNVKIFGILQPLEINQRNEIVLGSRRLEAAKLACIEKVPVIIRESSDMHQIEKQLVSDLHSKHLSVIERAFAFNKLLEMKQITKYALAKYLGLSHNLVCRTRAILEANPNTIELMKKEKISQRKVAMILYRLKDKSLEDYVMKEVIERKMDIVQAGNFIAELNDPEIFKKHFLRQVKSFKTSLENFKNKAEMMKLSEEQRKEIVKELKEVDFNI